MTKFKITTLKEHTTKYYLTYEVEAESEEQAKQEYFDLAEPIEEELFDENDNETVTDIEEI